MKISVTVFLLWAFTWTSSLQSKNISSILEKKSDEILSRRKRYIVFPKGSSLQLVYCNTYFLRPVVDIFRLGTTVGLAWQLPDDPMVYNEHNKMHKIYKRNVLKKMEAFIRSDGGNGQQCVLRALCESGQRTLSKKSFLQEVLYKIFSVNINDLDLDETHEDKVYKKAHNSTNQNCETLYPDCAFSIFKSLF